MAEVQWVVLKPNEREVHIILLSIFSISGFRWKDGTAKVEELSSIENIKCSLKL